jgi:hypothetical protein
MEKNSEPGSGMKIPDLMYENLKVPKCEIFDPFFLTPINPIWVGDMRTGEKKKLSKTTADIRHFVFFTQAEPALKICLRRLNLR